MNDINKIVKITGYFSFSGIILFVTSCALSIYTLCGLNNYPTSFEEKLCNFVNSNWGGNFIKFTYWSSLLLLTGGVILCFKVIDLRRSKNGELKNPRVLYVIFTAALLGIFMGAVSLGLLFL